MVPDGLGFAGLVKEVVEEEEENQGPCCKKVMAHHQQMSNGTEPPMMGRDMGYQAFHKGHDHEHLVWWECPGSMQTALENSDDDSKKFPAAAFYGDRFFCSGERQRIIKEVMRQVKWESKRSIWDGKPLNLSDEDDRQGFQRPDTVWGGLPNGNDRADRHGCKFSSWEFLPAGKMTEVDKEIQTMDYSTAAGAGEDEVKSTNLPALEASGTKGAITRHAGWEARTGEVGVGVGEHGHGDPDHEHAGKRDPTLFDFDTQDIECIRILINDPDNPGQQRYEYKPVYLVGIMALHNKPEQTWLIENWGSLSLPPGMCSCGGVCLQPRVFSGQALSQPMEEVRKYFGSETGLYFEWLGLYTRSLVSPAIVGGAVYAVQQANGFESPNDVGLLLVAYAIFLALWASVFVEMWKNREVELSFQWGTENVEEEEEVLKEFEGEERLIKREMDRPMVEIVHKKFFPHRCWRFTCTTCIVAFFLVLVIAVSSIALLMKADGAMVDLVASGSGSGSAPPPPQVVVSVASLSPKVAVADEADDAFAAAGAVAAPAPAAAPTGHGGGAAPAPAPEADGGGDGTGRRAMQHHNGTDNVAAHTGPNRTAHHNTTAAAAPAHHNTTTAHGNGTHHADSTTTPAPVYTSVQTTPAPTHGSPGGSGNVPPSSPPPPPAPAATTVAVNETGNKQINALLTAVTVRAPHSMDYPPTRLP